MTAIRVSGTEGYAEQASILLEQYEQWSGDEIHGPVMDYFPSAPSSIVDIGAGTGRDAGWFAEQGHEVVAVEPTAELREPGKLLHPSPRIKWLDDSLPELAVLREQNQKYELVMLNAVWMHLDADQRTKAMKHVVSVMKPGARLFMALRHGPVPQGRRMFDVSADETIALAATHGLVMVLNIENESIQKDNRAAGVWWSKLILELPI